MLGAILVMLAAGAGEQARNEPIDTAKTPPPLIRTQAPPSPTIVNRPVVRPPIAPPPAMPPPPPPPQALSPFKTRAELRSGAITADDYPAAAIRLEQEGATTARITIDASGRVADCAVTASSGSSALDSATCLLVTRRYRYRPATGWDDRPISSRASLKMVWLMPNELEPLVPPASWFANAPPAPPEQLAIVKRPVSFAVDIDIAGTPTSCEIDEGSGSDTLDRRTCDVVMKKARFAPEREFDGRPAMGIYYGSHDWRSAPNPEATSP